MIRYAMVVDLKRCVGCHTCSVACKAAWDVPENSGRSWVQRLGPDETPYGLSYTFYPGHCNHCQKPACVPVCPVAKKIVTLKDSMRSQSKVMEIAATWKDPFNSTVSIDPKRCIGCGACVEACPYEARYLKPTQGKNKIADKCTFCVERLVKGRRPVCVETCLGGARFFGDLNDPDSEVAQMVSSGAQALESRGGSLGPNVFYRGSKKDIYQLSAKCRPR